MKRLIQKALALAALVFLSPAFFCKPQPDEKPAPKILEPPPAAIEAPASPPPLLNLYWSLSFYASKNCQGEILRDSSYAFSHGLKFNWDAFELRLFNSSKKIGGGELWPANAFGDYERIFDRRRYSVSMDFSKWQKTLKTKFSLGSLKLYTQKRIAPFAASASPFAFSLSDSGALLASLPTKSSSPQENSFYAAASLALPKDYGSDTIRFMPVKAEFAISENQSDPGKAPFLASARGGLFYMNFFKLTGGILFARRYFEESGEAAFDWFDSVPIWKSELYSAAAADLCVEIPFVKSRTTFSVAESPASLGRSAFAQELLFEAGIFSLAAAFFASDNLFAARKAPWTAANGKESKKNWQAKITPQIAFKTKNGAAVQLGLGGFLEEQIKDWEKKSSRRSLEAKAAAGFKVCAKRDSLRLAASAGPFVLKENPGQEKAPPLAKISASFYYLHSFLGVKDGSPRGSSAKSVGRLAISGGASFQPEVDWSKREWTERLKAAYYPRNSFVSSVWAAFEASQKSGTAKFTPSAAASFLFRLKCVRLNASVSAAFPLSL